MMRSSAVLAIPAAVLTTTVALPVAAQDVLPGPDAPFKGHVGRTTKDFPAEVRASKVCFISPSPVISRRPERGKDSTRASIRDDHEAEIEVARCGEGEAAPGD